MRDSWVLACQGNSFRGRGKSTTRARTPSFVRAPSSPPRRQSRRQRQRRVAVDITRRLRGAVACPVSRRGIARDISPPLALPLAEESAQLPQMTIAATSRSPRRFNTSQPPPHQPPSLASVSSSHVMPRLRRWNDKPIYYGLGRLKTIPECWLCTKSWLIDEIVDIEGEGNDANLAQDSRSIRLYCSTTDGDYNFSWIATSHKVCYFRDAICGNLEAPSFRATTRARRERRLRRRL